MLPADYKGSDLTVNSRYRGVKPIAVSLNRELLIRALALGFGRLEFVDYTGSAPIAAKGNGGDLFILMPLRGESHDKIIEAVNKRKDRSAIQEHVHVRSFSKVARIENKKSIRINNAITQEAVQVPFSKEVVMPQSLSPVWGQYYTASSFLLRCCSPDPTGQLRNYHVIQIINWQ